MVYDRRSPRSLSATGRTRRGELPAPCSPLSSDSSIGRLLAKAFGVGCSTFHLHLRYGATSEPLPMDGPEDFRGWAFAARGISITRMSTSRRTVAMTATVISDLCPLMSDFCSLSSTSLLSALHPRRVSGNADRSEADRTSDRPGAAEE